jgi:hypothetical protein
MKASQRSPSCEFSKMVSHDLNSAPGDELLSLEEPVALDPADFAPLEDRFRAQMASSQRLNEYYKQVVAEIRASLEKIEAEEG